MLCLEHSSVWIGDVDAAKARGKLSGEFRDVLMEEDQMDVQIDKRRGAINRDREQ